MGLASCDGRSSSSVGDNSSGGVAPGAVVGLTGDAGESVVGRTSLYVFLWSAFVALFLTWM